MASSRQSGARRKLRGETSSLAADINVSGGNATITKNNCPVIIDSTVQLQQKASTDQESFEDSIDWDSEAVKKFVDGFITAQNNDTEKKTRDKVTATFSNLKTPEKQVNPRYIDGNFYLGQTAPNTKEYVPDSLYEGHEGRSIKGELIELTDFLNGVDYTALIADAGAGKTISAKRFARKVLEKQIPLLKNIKLVRYVTIPSLNSEEKYTAFDLFFENVLGDEPTDNMKKYGRYWVKKHSDKILLVLDGLDQADWMLDRNTKEDISYNRPASVRVIFRNLLCKNLFPDCKILITSREQAMLKFPPDIRPKKTVALNGLTEKDQEDLIKQLAGERAKDILHHLHTSATYLMSLCQIPAFLVFSVAVFEDNLEKLPETMSEVLISVLACFILSENKREHSTGDHIFKKLKQLAFNGTRKKRVLFTCEDLEKLSLDPREVRDLVVTTPHKKTRRDFHLVERKYNLFFSHQSIQEALTALYICDMPANDFKNFISHEIWQPHYSIVRRILCGVLLNPRMSDIEPVLETSEERKQKSRVVRKWLENLAVACKERSKSSDSDDAIAKLSKDDVELCRLLQECGESANDIIRQHLHPLKDNYEIFRTYNFFVFISSLSQLDELITDEISVHPANSAELKLFCDCLSKMRYVQVARLHIRGDPPLLFYSNSIGERYPKPTEQNAGNHSSDFHRHINTLMCEGDIEMPYIRKLIREFEIEEVIFHLFPADKISKLKDDLTADRGPEIKHLTILVDETTKPEVFTCIGEIIEQCKIEKVVVMNPAMPVALFNTISVEKDLKSGYKRMTLRFGCIFGSIFASSINSLQQIIKHCEIDELKVKSGRLSVEVCAALKKSLANSKLKIIPHEEELQTYKLLFTWPTL